MRQKKYKEAIEKYESIKEPTLEAKKLHNIGNAYAQMKKMDEAIKSYQEALKIADDADTKYNLELLKKKKEEQKKKQQQNKEDDKKNKQDKKDGQNKDQKNQDKKNQNDKEKDSDKQKSREQKDKEKKEAEKKKQEEQKKKTEQTKKEEKTKQAMMGDQNKTQPPISNMEERKWQKMLNQRGVNTLMIPLQQGENRNETNPW